MGAEEQLDNMEAEGQDGPEYLALRARVVEFVLAHPELREAPWLRCAGAVSDLLEALRVSRPEF